MMETNDASSRSRPDGSTLTACCDGPRAATDLALRATKVTAQSLGRTISPLVVQEHHLWLCLTDMEQEKVQLLNAPVSRECLFGYAVESFAQHFSGSTEVD